MERVGRKDSRGTETDTAALASIERKLLKEYLSHLLKVDEVAVEFARLRANTLRAISTIFSWETRENSWKMIDQIDKDNAGSDTYQGAVWALELLDPPLKTKGKNNHVVLFLTGKGSSYIKDEEGNVKPKVATE